MLFLREGKIIPEGEHYMTWLGRKGVDHKESLKKQGHLQRTWKTIYTEAVTTEIFVQPARESQPNPFSSS